MQELPQPNVYVFNPTCEYAIANGNASWQPNKLLQKMEADLASLPLFFAKSTDRLIVPQLPSKQYLSSLQETGIHLPEFITPQMLVSSPPKAINELRPWGWSPAIHKRLAALKNNCSPDFKTSPVFNWKPEAQNLYSKKFAQEILYKLTQKFPSQHFIDNSMLTQVCKTQHEIETLLEKWGKLMIKAPWSSSGRGLQTIRKTPVHPKIWDKVLGIIKNQHSAIVEPYLNKVIDLAFQFELRKGKIQFLGFSNFSTDHKGQYIGNSLNGLSENLPNEVKNFVHFVPSIILSPLIEILEASELATNYEGFFGVDTLIYSTKDGELKINPCLEINIRYNMGLLSLYLEKLISDNKKGIFRTWYQPGSSFFSFKNEMENKHPLVLIDGKVESGFFALTEARKDTLFGAYFLV